MEVSPQPATTARRRRPLAYVIAAVAAATVWWLGAHLAGAATAEPGSPDDPLVSRSFVQQYVQQALQEKLPDAVQKILQPALLAANQQTQVAVAQQMKTALAEQAQQSLFTVVSVTKGARLLAQGGTEIVLRAGQATVVAGAQGGLADLSAGVDLQQGQPVPANHLLLVPRTEGRGLVAGSDVILLIKGTFTVQQATG